MRRFLLPALPLFVATCACSGSSDSPPVETPTDTAPIDESSIDTAPGDETTPPPGDSGGDVATDTSTGDTGPDPTDRSKCTADPDKVGITKRTATYKTATMTYTGYAPPTYDPKKPQSVVIALHGAGDTMGNYFAGVWKANADSKNFLVITPEGSSPAGPGFTWNSGDANLILSTIDDFEQCYTVNTHRRILHGFSAGGIMAYFIGFSVAEVFAGTSISSSDFDSAQAIAGKKLLPAKWLIPVSHFHGTSDTNFPIASARKGRDELIAAGHKVYWHEFAGGHTTNAGFAATMYDDLASSTAP